MATILYESLTGLYGLAYHFARVSLRPIKLDNRELKQRRRRRRGRRQVKNEFIFYQRNLRLSRSVRCANGSKIVPKLNMQRRRSIPNGITKNQPSWSMFCRRHRTWSFHVLVLKRTAKKCTKIYNARAQLLFCSLNLLFSDVLVAIDVVICLSSLIIMRRRRQRRLKYFTYESWNTLRSFTLLITVKALAKLNLGHLNKFETDFLKNQLSYFTFFRQCRIGHFMMLFGRGRQRNVQRFITHMHSHCSAH